MNVFKNLPFYLQKMILPISIELNEELQEKVLYNKLSKTQYTVYNNTLYINKTDRHLFSEIKMNINYEFVDNVDIIIYKCVKAGFGIIVQNNQELIIVSTSGYKESIRIINALGDYADEYSFSRINGQQMYEIEITEERIIQIIF